MPPVVGLVAIMASGHRTGLLSRIGWKNDWLKAQRKRYQSKINAILRREMLTSGKSAK
jgi:hypothetical protein